MFRLLIALSALAAPLALAAPPEALLAFTRDLQTLEGRFEQQAFDANGRVRERSEGAVAMAAPRQFRWDYVLPYPQAIIADGTRLWVYDPELEQVSVRLQAQEEQSNPLAALIDPAILEAQFEVERLPDADGLVWLKLVPRKLDDAPISEARIGLAQGELRRMQLVDSLQQRSEFSFSGWQRNGPLPAERFRFVPPPGVDVVGDPGSDAEVIPLDDPQG